MNVRLAGAWLGSIALIVGIAAPYAVAKDDSEKAPNPETAAPLDRNVPRHHEINKRAREGSVEVIFIGDSITQGWEGAGQDVWKKRYERRKAMNAGIGGDRTQHILWRLDNGNIEGLSPKLAVLMIGTNNIGANTPKDIALGIKAILEKLRTKLPETKVLLLGVFPRGEKPDDALREANVVINSIIKYAADGEMVHYLDINDKLLNADGKQNPEIMPDFVHLSPKGYQIWSDAMEQKINELLGEVAFPELPKGAKEIDADAPTSFTATKSGLKYRILRKGKGAMPTALQTVEVNYHGWLDGGKVFDSSYQRGQSISFPLNRVIPGWTEGMQLVGAGGMIELEIPGNLAYGQRGAPPDIGPNATLHFLVELLEVR